MNLARDPLFACCVMFPTDRELSLGTSDIDIGDFTEDSFQGFPLRAARVVRRQVDPAVIAEDLAACGFNAAMLVGFCGSNFTPDDLRSPRFVALTRALKDRGLSVGLCIPFADTFDNALTTADPRMHQVRHDGKRPYVRFDADLAKPPYPIFVIDFGSAPFVAFAKRLVEAARDAGMDFIDYAEPDYWPTEGNGYHPCLEAAWRREHGAPLPYPSTLDHRLFMEDWHIEAMRKISAHAHRNGLQDHLTASPMGHAPYHICQNYGKYGNTSVTKLSSTYHYLYGLAWKERLARRYGIDCALHRMSSLGCMEVRSMRRWEERHDTYLVPGQSLPALTYANALDQQMLLHNMDVVFWEYPSIRTNYYESTDAWASPEDAWQALRTLFAEKSKAYRSLPAEFHAAIPAPEALVFYSKRGVYADEADDAATPCSYVQSLRLMAGGVQPLFLFAEDLSPLASRTYDPRLLLIDEHHPVPPGGWQRIEEWLARGSRVAIYGGGPGLLWETDKKAERFPPAFRKLFGIDTGTPAARPGQAAGRGGARQPDTPCPVAFPFPGATRPPTFTPGSGAQVIARASGRPLVSMKAVGETSRAIYVSVPLCELPGTSFAQLSSWILASTGTRSVTMQGQLDLEHCFYRGKGKRWLAVKNHSTESRTTTFTVATGFRPAAVRELLTGKSIPVRRFATGCVIFDDTPGPNSIGIYEAAR